MTESDNRAMYYDRVLKIVGTRLAEKAVVVYGAPFVARVIEMLASCGMTRFHFQDGDCGDGRVIRTALGLSWGDRADDFARVFERHLRSMNEYEDRWDFAESEHPDIVIGGGSFETCRKAYEQAQSCGVPCVVGLLFRGDLGLLSVALPGDPFPLDGLMITSQDAPPMLFLSSYMSWIDLNNQLASIAKAVLLQGTEWERSDVSQLLRAGMKTVLTGHPSWPWPAYHMDMNGVVERSRLCGMIQDARSQPSETGLVHLRGKRVMIIGIGSMGSVVADRYRALGASIVGVDGKNVSVYNPVRQLYPTSSVGKPKASELPWVLRRRKKGARDGIRQEFEGVMQDIEDTREGGRVFKAMVERHRPDLVVLTTAHSAEFRMAKILRESDIPHVVGRCYPRARWFEIFVVNGKDGPCYGCYQGHLYTGVSPLLTEEQLAAYDTEAVAGPGETLSAEPAVRMDTERAADAVARLGLELLLSDENRSQWFRRMLAKDKTCLIGGNCAERQEDGEWSLGIRSPGAAILYGAESFVGSAGQTGEECIYCGRNNRINVQRIGNRTLEISE